MADLNRDSIEVNFWERIPLPRDLYANVRGYLYGERRGPGGMEMFQQVELRSTDAKMNLLVETKESLNPKDIEFLKRRLDHAITEHRQFIAKSSEPERYFPAVATRASSSALRDACLRVGLGLFDLTGTILIHQGPMFVHVEGTAEPGARRGPVLFRGAATRVVRLLLTEPASQLTASDVAKRTGVSIPYALRVLTTLELNGFVNRQSPRKGFRTVDPRGLLRAWMKSPEIPWAAAESYNARSLEPKLIDQARLELEDSKSLHRWTLSAVLRPFSDDANAEEATVFALPIGLYLVGDSQPLVELLGLRKVTPFNFMILRPRPEDAVREGGIVAEAGSVPLCQLAVDFAHLGGRGAEQAQHLFNRWSAALPMADRER